MTIGRPELALKTAAVERHLRRVASLLPASADDLVPETEASDGVILHLWQAVQICVDLAISTAVALGLGTPPTYGDAFRALAAAGHLPPDLTARLVAAAGFLNLVAHAYERIDLRRVHAAASTGPADLRSFLAAMEKLSRP